MILELSIETAGAPEGLQGLLERVCKCCCQVEGVENMHVACRLVDDAAIREINKTFRGIDRATDVISFPSVHYAPGRTARTSSRQLRREHDPATGGVHLGDYVLSLDHARAQAAEYGHSLARELGYLSAHAMFHLMGYDHEEEEDRRLMRAMEEKAMDLACLSRDGTSDEELFRRAVAMLDKAYAPYSGFRVGACILGASGSFYGGCNIENASYGATICAERAAVCQAVCQGERRFSAIAVVGVKVDAWPCGICRQVLSEFCPNMRVVCGNAKSGSFTCTTLDQLLPLAFGSDDLKQDHHADK